MHRQQGGIAHKIDNISAESRQITKEKIRAQLLTAAEQEHQADLAQAERATTWQDRQRLRDAAEKSQTSRLSRIDELAASFAELEGTAKVTNVFDEMTRILAEQGVDQALAYVDSQRQGILETVKARAVAARERNRADLRPLLKSAQLMDASTQSAKAEELYGEILALEPDWPEALDEHFWFSTNQGDRAKLYETLVSALKHYSDAEATARHLRSLEPDKSEWERDLSVSFNRIGDVKSLQGDHAGALASCQSALDIDRKLALADPSKLPRASATCR